METDIWIKKVDLTCEKQLKINILNVEKYGDI